VQAVNQSSFKEFIVSGSTAYVLFSGADSSVILLPGFICSLIKMFAAIFNVEL